MTPNNATQGPIDLLQFVSAEHQQFLISMVKSRPEFDAHSHLQGLFQAVLSQTEVPEDDMVLIQLLVFIHYHFVYSHACLFRCHLSEAFASARSAIDAALIGAFIIDDRSLQVQYLKREAPFNNLARHLGNMVREKKPMPHRLVPALREVHGNISRFASHADIDSFMHRVEITEKDEKPLVQIQYFQFSRNDAQRKLHFVQLLLSFVLVLDVFSDFLVSQLKSVPKQWQDELRGLGQALERGRDEIKKQLPADT
ncbi:MAG: hypothetical protein EPO55_09905 [Reyranella sp.]|uniref:hypothetical protein n=1 Tax=Reyranella sp. TaxID=1929291 RepID=UPI0012272241|nr:hypothetical protein [Reyranella sp.]TAJ40047.1 MAG: hypothetical protein EPO55_09905 [Reyranella sp.]